MQFQSNGGISGEILWIYQLMQFPESNKLSENLQLNSINSTLNEFLKEDSPIEEILSYQGEKLSLIEEEEIYDKPR